MKNYIYHHIYSILSLIAAMLNLYLTLSSFYFNISGEMLWEFCFIKKSVDFAMSFNMLFLSLAVVIIPIVSLRDPSIMNVVPNLLYKSNDTPPILQS